jgi:hypothetical protein
MSNLTQFEKELKALEALEFKSIDPSDIVNVRIGEMILVTTLTGMVSRRFGGFLGGVPHYFGKDSNILFPETDNNRIKRMPPMEWNSETVEIPSYLSRVAIRASSGFISVVTRSKVRIIEGEHFSWLPLD